MKQNNFRNAWKTNKKAGVDEKQTSSFPGPQKIDWHILSDKCLCDLWTVPPDLQETNTNIYIRTVHLSFITCGWIYHSGSYITVHFSVNGVHKHSGYQCFYDCTEPRKPSRTCLPHFLDAGWTLLIQVCYYRRRNGVKISENEETPSLALCVDANFVRLQVRHRHIIRWLQ